MKVAAVVLFAVVIAFTIPLCCEGHEQVGGNAAKGLSPFGDSYQQQPLSKKSQEVIVASRKWLKGVINDSHIHEEVKKAFLEMHGKKVVRVRAKRWLGALTIASCLTSAALSAINKACNHITSEWVCYMVGFGLRVVTKIADIADGSVILQLICDHLGELTYDAGRFLHQLVCEWARTAYENSLFVDYFC